MTTELVINARDYETRLVVLEDGQAVEYYIERASDPTIVGNIYRGRVLRVLPGMEAAFVDIGLDKAGFLYVSDVLPQVWDLNGDLVSLPSGQKEYRIEYLLQPGQEVLVQVAREAVGSKGPRLTTRITLPGHFLVLLPLFDYIGISRRIEEEEERKRLHQIIAENKPEGMGFIIRTAAKGVDSDKLIHEMHQLINLWQQILEKKKTTPLPGLVYGEPDLCLRALRDFFGQNTRRLIIDDPKAYQRVLDYAKTFLPHLLPFIELYEGKEHIFKKMGIENDINHALQSVVSLKSGGYLVIEKTEALVVIDVNTGSFVGENNLEDTIVQTNLEAANEIARQLRLRDLGGIIIIDFIDMQKEEDKQKVLNTLEQALKKDRSKTKICHMSQLGLVEMTRKRTREDLQEYLCEPCPYCQGRGFVKSKRTLCYELIRKLEKTNVLARKVGIKANPELIQYIKEKEWKLWQQALENIGKKVEFISAPQLHIEDYEILEIW